MLEKNAFAGGAGNFMEGSFAAESFMQKEKGVKLTKIQAFNEMAAYHHWRINAPLVKAFVDLSRRHDRRRVERSPVRLPLHSGQ
jgi:fumarate reductase flavoprotein subunit